MDTQKLWNERAAAFWGEVIPYLRYVASSGLAAFLILFFIVSTHYYAKFLDNLPEDLPVDWISLVILLPFIAYSPIRTFLKQADLIYLLPAEGKMNPYVRKAITVSYIRQGLITALIWFMIWPLYRVSEGAAIEIFWFILLFLMVMKGVNIYGSWYEKQIFKVIQKHLYILFRWSWTAGLLYLLFTYSLLKVVIFGLFVMLTYLVSLRLASRHKIHWEDLIEVERNHRAGIYLFLSWFVDVPERQSRVHARRFLSGITKYISFQQKNTYRYLYLKTWVRSDLFGILLRLVLIGTLVIYTVPQDILKLIFFVFFIYITGVQLTALEHHHRYIFWLQVYPLPEFKRIEAVHYIMLRVHFCIIILLYIAILSTYVSKVHAAGILFISIILFLLYHFKLRRDLIRK